MKRLKLNHLPGFTALFVIAYLLCSFSVYGSFLYKSYVVRYDRGRDILCDPYVVKKNDWVLKVFRQKGEISHRDFPEFLRIFKRINPHINDIDRIRPGQHIVIPLKKINRDTLPGQSTGVVTIPFVTLSETPDSVRSFASDYRVKQGDCVSILISRMYGKYGSKPYIEGIKLFRLNNPDIEDLDQIYAGQIIRIPDPAIRKQPWYPSLFNRSHTEQLRTAEKNILSNIEKSEGYNEQSGGAAPGNTLEKIAWALNAKLVDHGIYYLPVSGQKDYQLDLARFPLIEMGGGTRILFSGNKEKPPSVVKSFWKNVKIIYTDPEDSEEKVLNAVFKSFENNSLKESVLFSDNGVEVEVRGNWIFADKTSPGELTRYFCITLIDNPGQRIPPFIVRYLDQNNIIIKDVFKGENLIFQQPERPDNISAPGAITIVTDSNHRVLVKNMITALGYRYAANVSISFPYAGTQVNAVTNLITKNEAIPLLVDFEDLYGDAVKAIENTGFKVVQIRHDDDISTIIKKLAGILQLSYTNNPTFFAANRPILYNTGLTIPGVLLSDKKRGKTLCSFVSLSNEVAGFLQSKGVRIVWININT